MVSVVLRVSGEHLDLDACIAWAPDGGFDAVWRSGEKDRRGKARATSGFNLCLSDDDDASVAVETAMAAFAAVASRLSELVEQGATAEVDFGLDVGEDFPRSVRLEVSDLRSLEQCGVGLCVSAYPCSD